MRPLRAQTVIPIVGDLGCSQCTLDKEVLRHPKMPPSGADQPQFYFIGEAPGETEDELGRQFVGRSGELIRDRVPVKWEKHIRWNNALKCRPPDNREPTDHELACCRRYLEDDIAATRPAAIVTFGRTALDHLIGGIKKISDWRGRRIALRVKDHICWLYPLEHPAFVLRMQRSEKQGPSITAAFEHDLQRVFDDAGQGLPEAWAEDPTQYKENIQLILGNTDADLDRIESVLGEMAALDDTTLDIETNRERPYYADSKILSMSVGTYENTIGFGIEHPGAKWTEKQRYRLSNIIRIFLLKAKRKWAHFAKFEQEWIVDEWGPQVIFETEWHDTGALAHTADERAGKKLNDLTQIFMGFRVKAVMDLDTSRLIEYPLADVLMHNALDVKYTDAVRGALQAVVDSQGLSHVAHRFDLTLPSLVMMQQRGVPRDEVEVGKLYQALVKEEQRMRQQIAEHTDVKRFIQTNGKFLPSSNGPTGDLVKFFRDFMKCEEGYINKRLNKYSVDEDHLLQIRHPVAKMILDMRKVNKNKGTYVIKLLNKQHALELAQLETDKKEQKKLLEDGGQHVYPDNLIHADFGHLITVTTRLACSDPNLQNFPSRKNKEIRRVLVPPPGHKLVSADFGQLEARTIAFVSQDPTLKAETWRNDDIHGVWTDRIGGHFIPNKIKDKDGRKEFRNAIKNTWTFPLFFGNVLEAVAFDLSREMDLDVSSRTAQKDMIEGIRPYFEEFWQKYPRVKQWQEELMTFYWSNHYCETLLGFRRREPMPRNEIINHPIQGTAAQIVLDAQIRLARMAYERGMPQLQPVMNIHDDLTFFIPVGTLEQDIEIIAREMACCPFPFIDVPLSVEVSIGDNWCDKAPLHTFLSTDFDPNYGKRQ